MKLNVQQIRKIISAAPAGMNHIGCYRGRLCPMPNSIGTIHNLFDLQQIANLTEQRDMLLSALGFYLETWDAGEVEWFAKCYKVENKARQTILAVKGSAA